MILAQAEIPVTLLIGTETKAPSVKVFFFQDFLKNRNFIWNRFYSSILIWKYNMIGEEIDNMGKQNNGEWTRIQQAGEARGDIPGKQGGMVTTLGPITSFGDADKEFLEG